MSEPPRDAPEPSDEQFEQSQPVTGPPPWAADFVPPGPPGPPEPPELLGLPVLPEPAPPPPAPPAPPFAMPEPRGPGHRRAIVAVSAGVVALLLGLSGLVVALGGGDPDGSSPEGQGPRLGSVNGSPAAALPGAAVPASGSATTAPASPTPTPTPSAQPSAPGSPGTGPSSQPSTSTPRPPATPRPTTAPAPPPTSAAPEPPQSTTPTSRVCTTSGCAGDASFTPYGEHLIICDKNPDGKGVRVEYRRSDVPNQNNIQDNRGGNGTCRDVNFDMPEGATITYRVCLINSSNVTSNCSARVTDTA